MQRIDIGQKIAQSILTQNARLYDICSIVLLSIGVNIFTYAAGAPDLFAAVVAVFSGIALSGSGIIVSGIRVLTEAIIADVNDNLNMERGYLEKINEEDVLNVTIDSVYTGHSRDSQQYIDDAIANVMKDRDLTAWKVVSRIVIALILFCLGVFGASWSLLFTEDASSNHAAEILAQSIRQDVSVQITDLQWDVAALSAYLSDLVKSLIDIEESEAIVNQELMKEMKKIRSDIIVLSIAVQKYDPTVGKN